MPFAISSDPASELGHKTIACIFKLLIAFKVLNIWFSPSPYSVVTGCCDTNTKSFDKSNFSPTPP